MTSRGWGSQASVNNYLLHWRENNYGPSGEGISRTTAANAKLYELVVTFSGMKPMREWLRATSSAEAAMFAANKYPANTNITVVTQDNATRSA
jgi:hypothetical protein